MFRKALLPALALAVLSGCATDYTYRNGNGDYYYGRPQVEYRHIGGYGYGYDGYGYGYGYRGYGGYGYGSPGYYYDRFGRLVYGSPYSVYGSPYPYGTYRSPYSGNHWRYRARPPHGGVGRDHDRDGDHDRDRDGDTGRPPWRNIGGIRPGTGEGQPQARGDDRLRNRPAPFIQSTPGMERPFAPQTRSGDDDGSSVGTRARGIGRARARTTTSTQADEE